MQEGPFPTFPAYNRHSSRKARAFLFVGLFILLVGVVIVAGNFFLNSQQINEAAPIVAGETPTPTSQSSQATPTETPTPTQAELDKSELSVQALNGSGASGAASELASVLREAGYTVASTGNADEFEYEQTVVQIKKSQEAYADLLIEDLSKEYEVSSEVETLSENARFDAIVIIGAN